LRQLRRRVNSRTALHVARSVSASCCSSPPRCSPRLARSPLLFRTGRLVRSPGRRRHRRNRRHGRAAALDEASSRPPVWPTGTATDATAGNADGPATAPAAVALRPVLVAQILALGARWDPRRVAPVASRAPCSCRSRTAHLVATAILEQQAPAAAATQATATRPPTRDAQARTRPASPQDADQITATGQDVRPLARTLPPHTYGQHPGSPGAGRRGTPRRRRRRATRHRTHPQPIRAASRRSPGTLLAAVPDRLQNTIRQALQGDAADAARHIDSPRRGAGQRSRIAEIRGRVAAPVAARTDQSAPCDARGIRCRATRTNPFIDPGRSKADRSGPTGTDGSQQSGRRRHPVERCRPRIEPTPARGRRPRRAAGAGTTQQPFALTITSFLHMADAPAPRRSAPHGEEHRRGCGWYPWRCRRRSRRRRHHPGRRCPAQGRHPAGVRGHRPPGLSPPEAP